MIFLIITTCALPRFGVRDYESRKQRYIECISSAMHLVGVLSATSGICRPIIVENSGDEHAAGFLRDHFQDHADIQIAGHSIRYLAPSSIDADPDVKVVLFKTSLNSLTPVACTPLLTAETAALVPPGPTWRGCQQGGSGGPE